MSEMKFNIYLNSANENWVVDRFRNEWFQYGVKQTPLISLSRKDIIWLIAPWTWNKVPKYYLKNRKVVCTIHHIDMKKFDKNQREEFLKRDEFVDCYHSISPQTTSTLKTLTDKRIVELPFWINENLFFPINNKQLLREKYLFDSDEYLLGSFQRDTEGKDLISPKLEKGPDIFIEIVKKMIPRQNTIKVVLTGKRRQYIISKLEELEIPFSYFELVTFEELNELYNILDLYVVSSRVEGGPQSIMECAISKTPIISTNVGISTKILNKESIYDTSNVLEAKPEIISAFNNVQKYKTTVWTKEYKDFFNSI